MALAFTLPVGTGQSLPVLTCHLAALQQTVRAMVISELQVLLVAQIQGVLWLKISDHPGCKSSQKRWPWMPVKVPEPWCF
jgi:hypothetical protein